MSDLRPRGIPIVLDGVERHFLFTLNTIDVLQDNFGKNIHEIISDLANADVTEHTLRDMTVILLNDEAYQAKRMHIEPVPAEVDVKTVGDMIGLDNYADVLRAMLRAYGISMPDAEEDENPNRESGQ